MTLKFTDIANNNNNTQIAAIDPVSFPYIRCQESASGAHSAESSSSLKKKTLGIYDYHQIATCYVMAKVSEWDECCPRRDVSSAADQHVDFKS